MKLYDFESNYRLITLIMVPYTNWKQVSLGTLSKKNTGFFGNFSQVLDPPPFWEPLFPKKKYGLFCILGPLEHFWSSSKCSGYKFYFHLLGSTGSQLDVAQPRALTLSLEEYTTINYSHFCPSVRVVLSSISLLHVPSFLSHFLTICVSSWDLDFSLSFSILSPS